MFTVFDALELGVIFSSGVGLTMLTGTQSLLIGSLTFLIGSAFGVLALRLLTRVITRKP